VAAESEQKIISRGEWISPELSSGAVNSWKFKDVQVIILERARQVLGVVQIASVQIAKE